MVYKWLQIAKAEFFVLTARFKGHRKLVMALFLLNEIPPLRTVLGGLVILGTVFAVTLRGARH